MPGMPSPVMLVTVMLRPVVPVPESSVFVTVSVAANTGSEHDTKTTLRAKNSRGGVAMGIVLKLLPTLHLGRSTRLESSWSVVVLLTVPHALKFRSGSRENRPADEARRLR